MLQTQHVKDNSKHVKVTYHYDQVQNCRYISELVGSEGHWYTFFFISNAELTVGSINDLKNQADEVGADSVLIDKHLGFGTSVTLLAEAYHCQAK